VGLMRGLAYMIDPNMAREADKRQAEYDQAMGIGQYGGGEGFVSGIINGWRASRYGRRYQQDNRTIQAMMNPHQGPPNTVTQMLSSARGRCTCGDPNCGYNR
jgi:hypothetical protein